MNTKKILSISLLSGAVYFAFISIAHQFQIKVPMLFIYYDVPSMVYQDKIISFMAFGWAMFFYSAYAALKKNLLLPIHYILFAGLGAVIGLIIIQLTTNFEKIARTINPDFFWLEIGGLMIYLCWLTYLYFKVKKSI